ncbi:hypothetical protein ARMGADRAFT_1082021 [Armillaria gallica]|uniref:Uncharacterized protein n=1 Tax=Armillaria gallica TaxID=47427 RepID=A0A2H3D7P3_ARMGA|nr:hypothetical protein ARMGADRAFT_1082021 [Armillaria gallica]
MAKPAGDEKETAATTKKRPLNTVNQLHMKELEESAKQCSKKNVIQLKELKIEKQHNDAKIKKMWLYAWQQEQQMDLMRMFFTHIVTPGGAGQGGGGFSDGGNNANMLQADSELYWFQYTPESLTDTFRVSSQSASESADGIEYNI